MTKKPRDIDVRHKLYAHLQQRFGRDANTLIIHELGLCAGTSRIDLAVVNGHLHGFEIKSPSDSLHRLAAQASMYSAVFDYVSIVVGSNHISKATDLVPEWWGVMEAKVAIPVQLHEVRAPRLNPSPDPVTILRLLWRDEILAILRQIGHEKEVRGKNRQSLCEAVGRLMPLCDVQLSVREKLKARGDWRVGPTPFRGDGLYRSSAKSLHSPKNRQWLLSLGSPDRQS